MTVAQYFYHSFQQFFHLVIKSVHNPIHKITDYFMRIEFAGFSTVHIQWFAYIKDANEYGKDSNDDIAAFYEQIISCSLDVPDNCKPFI